MVCLVPAIHLPPDLADDVLDSVWINTTDRLYDDRPLDEDDGSRNEAVEVNVTRTTSTSHSKGPGNDSRESLDFYVGFVLDGVKTYTNVSTVIPKKEIKFRIPPSFKYHGVIDCQANTSIVLEVRANNSAMEYDFLLLRMRFQTIIQHICHSL